ncbi:guanylate cyclase 2G-like protein [Labeo rohita]|uniref:Guanylate cyclase 2G-like protein n=1 Tax=Labeo rohita TaxID=84645 RepID=A0A498M388_LABRO|nr:guanylate cyclase 2G-like protein [Labeo rohita]
MCPAAAKTLGSDISLLSKLCRTTTHLANKAYAADSEAASVLHAMAVLQVFQAKLLQMVEGRALTPNVVNDLRAAMDFVLMAMKHAAHAIGKA